MKPIIMLCAALAAFGHSVAAGEVREVPELAEIFRAHRVNGTFVMFDAAADTMLVSNAARAQQRFAPASTFKIPNSLIGLELGAVKGLDEIIPYGGKPQRLKQWERDMNLRDAIQASNVPVYQEIARRVGLERMRAAVEKLDYGNMQVGEVVDRFWLDGPLAISAMEQAEFLHRLVAGKLPFDAKHIAAVKEITRLEESDVHALHGKTGWYWPGEGGQQIGWWVGWVERDGTAWPFALNIDINADADAAKRIPIARECLERLGKL